MAQLIFQLAVINHIGDFEFHIKFELEWILTLIINATQARALARRADLPGRIHRVVERQLVFVFRMKTHAHNVGRN